MKPLNFFLLLTLILLPVDSHPQSLGARPIVGYDDLVPALLETKNEAAALSLLKAHQDSITPYLWYRLMDEAGESTNRTLFVLELAKHVAEQLEDKRRLAHTYSRIGYARFSQGDLNAAIDAYLLSKGIFEETESRKELIYVLSELGNVLSVTGDFQKAEEYSKESLALASSPGASKPSVSGWPDKYGVALAWSNLGQVSMWKGDYNAALGAFDRSLALWEELNRGGLDYGDGVISALTSIGVAHRMMGDHTQALRFYYRALGLAKRVGRKGGLAALLSNMGVLYTEQRDYPKASECLNESLQLFTEVNNKRETVCTLINIGALKLRVKNYDQAIESFRNALNKGREVSALDLVVAAQQGLGVVYYESGEYASAVKWFDDAWSLAERIGDKIRMTELLWRKGQVFFSRGEYERASINAKAAADLAARLKYPLMTNLALTLLGKAYRARREHGAAEQAFTQAISTVEHMRDQIAGGEKEQQLYFEDKLTPYHEMVSLLAEANRAEDALEYAERAKGRVLLDVLRNGRINVNRSLSQNEQSEEARLYSEMVSLNAQIRVERMQRQPDDSRIDEIEIRLRRARSAYEAFQTVLYAAHPELEIKRGQSPPFTKADAWALVPDMATAVLEYVVTDEQTYLFVLTRNSRTQPKEIEITVRPVRIRRNDLSNLVEKHRTQLSTNRPTFRQTGRELYDLLIKPAEPYMARKTTLCIVPDGPLWNLPFQALQTEKDQYTLEQYAIYYAPSLQVLREMRKRVENLQTSPLSKSEAHGGSSLLSARQSEDLYAIGNPAVGGEALARTLTLRNAPFVPLPETEKEVRALATEVYGPQSSLVHVGSAAREELVKAEMGKYRVLHFATHGVLDNRNPLYSYIVLAPSGDSKEDGLLEAWELMEMDLKAELVVLSACDSARGRVGDGEGLIGMTWSLFVAGVPTMIASQWQVPSESTTKLMLSFHKNLVGSGSGETSKAEAWRQAALGMINDPRYRLKPYYWAGFVVTGAGGR